MSIVLYGMISANGIRVLTKSNINFSSMKNIVIIAVMLVLGLGGAFIGANGVGLSGMSLAVIVGIILNAILPNDKNEEPIPATLDKLFKNYKEEIVYKPEIVLEEEVKEIIPEIIPEVKVEEPKKKRTYTKKKKEE